MASQNLLMLEMLLEDQARWKADQRLEWERIAAEREPIAAEQNQRAAKRAKRAKHSIVDARPNIYKIVDPVQYCGGAKEPDRYLDTLLSNFNSHGHLFPRSGPDHVNCTISLLHTWSHHQNLALRPTAMPDPSEWARD